MIVVIPPLHRGPPQPPRVQRLFTLFTTMSPILPIQLNSISPTQSLQSCAEQIISITRSKIQELKAENPDRRLLLIGMHSSASLALQVALIEQVSGVVCFGFSYNTVHGTRGQPDDQILNTNCPVLLMIGQNAAKTNDEELEGLREKLNAQSTVQIAVVGGADDYLRISKKKRRLEGVTQEMVDNMIVDEITDFATNCIQRPIPMKIKTLTSVVMNREIDSSTALSRKRKGSNDDGDIKKVIRVAKMKPTKVAVKSQQPVSVSSSEMALEMAVQSITSDNEAHTSTQYQRITTTDAVMSQSKIKTTQKPIINQQQVIRHKNIIQVSRSVDQKNQKFLPIVQQSPHQQQQQTNFSPPKFTIVRSSTGTQQNIYDMPVVYADNEGNVVDNPKAPKISTSDSSIITIPSDSSSASSPSPTNITKRIVLKSSNIPQGSVGSTITFTKNKNILIQKPPANSKMVVLNSIVGRPISASNIIIPSGSAQTISGPIVRMQKSFITNTDQPLVIKPASSATQGGRKIEILNNTLIKPAQVPSGTTVSVSKPITFVNLADAKPMTSKISINPVNVKGGQLIVKTANLKPLTLPIGSKQFGNLTVSKFNVVTPSSTASQSTSNVANIVKTNP